MNTILASIMGEADFSGSATRQKVRWYQTVLEVAGGFPGLVVDGDHNDPATMQAMREFHRRHGLEGLEEIGHLRTRSNHAVTQVALEWIYQISLPNPMGSSGQVLKEQIKKFQSHYGLDPDGQVGPLTREKMIAVLVGGLATPLRGHHRMLGPALDQGSSMDGVAADSASHGGCRRDPDTLDYLGIIEPDERHVVPHASMLRVPWRWTCLVSARYDDPDGSGQPLWYGGSGVMIGARHVLTAAHVVLDEVTGSAGRRKKLAAKEVVVIPACDGLVGSRSIDPSRTVTFSNGQIVAAPFGIGRAVGNPSFKVHSAWKEQLERRYDYAVLRLNRAIGFERVPGRGDERLGWWGSKAHGPGTSIQPASIEYLRSRGFVHAAGYPRRARSHGEIRRQLWGRGEVANTPERDIPVLMGTVPFIYHDVDLVKGQSGGPIWTLEGNGARNLVGINSFVGAYVGADFEQCGSLGVHLSASVLEQIKSWMR